MADFHRNGSPGYVAERVGSIPLGQGRVAQIYRNHGYRWGNYEAMAYVEEPQTINFLVFNARTKELFEQQIPAFEAIATSYRNAYHHPPLSDEAFAQLQQESDAQSTTEAGGRYEQILMQPFGNTFADIVHRCLRYDADVTPAFDLLFRVAPSGAVEQVGIRPNNALTDCIHGMVGPTRHPPHDLATFVEHIHTKIAE